MVGMGIAVTGFTDRGEYEETVLLEGFEYYRNAPNDEWQVRTSRFSPGNIAPINAMTHLKYTSELTGSEEIGEDFYRGVEVIKIAGNSVMETKAERLFPDPQSWSAEQEAFHSDARSQFLLGSEEVEVWIGEEDDLVRKVIVVANFPEYGKEEAYSFVAEMTFSDFNQTSFEIPVTQ